MPAERPDRNAEEACVRPSHDGLLVDLQQSRDLADGEQLVSHDRSVAGSRANRQRGRPDVTRICKLPGGCREDHRQNGGTSRGRNSMSDDFRSPPPPPPPTQPVGASTSPRSWRTWHLITAAAVALLVGIGVGAASRGSTKSNAASTTTSTQTSTPAVTDETTAVTDTTEPATTTTQPPTTTAPPAFGTKDHPDPVGATATVGDWNVTVLGFTADGTAAVMSANQFNTAPQAGESYSIIHVRATYEGDGKGTAGISLGVAFVGSDARSYDASSALTAAGPNEMSSQPDVFKGGTVDGNVVIEAPSAVVSAGGEISVNDQLKFGTDPVWWSTK